MGGVSDGQNAAGLALLILFLMLCFILSYFQGAVSSATTNSIKKNKGSKTEKALRILENEEKYLRRFRIGYMFNLSGAVVAAEWLFLNGLSGLMPYPLLSYVLSAVVILLAVLLIGTSLCGLAAERIGGGRNEKGLLKWAGAIRWMNVLMIPLAVLPELLSDGIIRLSGNGRLADEECLTEEEIRMMVDEGEETGIIEGNTKDMIENIFDFDDTCVGEIMTHRKDVVAVRDDALLTDVAEAAIRSGKSRIPVYHEDIDNITGMIHVKDLLPYVSTASPEGKIDEAVIKEAVFVPESKRCSEMFEYMTHHKTQIAVVVDEFGGTGGIITMEDLVESIVGSIQDEFDNEDEEIRRLDENSFTVDGAASLDEIGELTGLNFDGDDNDTIAGVMLDRMGHIPKSGEHPSVMINGVRFTVQEVENRRIAKILVVMKKKGV